MSLNAQRAIVGTVLVTLLTLSGCSGGDEQTEPPNPVPTDQPEIEATAEPAHADTSPLVPDEFFAQFPTFEPLHAGASSDHVAEITSGTWTFPAEATAGYVQITSRESGRLHVLPSQGESDTNIDFSVNYNSFGENWFPHRIELVYNIAGANPVTGALETSLAEVTHLYLNTVWSDWEAVLRPIADVPELSTAIADGMSGTAGSYMFRHNGEPIEAVVFTQERLQGDLATTDRDEISMYGVSPKAGETQGHILVPAGAAWVNLQFDGDWELDIFDGANSLDTTAIDLADADQLLYTHDGRAVTVTNDYPDVEYHPISMTGESLPVLTGDQLEFPEGTWWVYARPLASED